MNEAPKDMYEVLKIALEIMRLPLIQVNDELRKKAEKILSDYLTLEIRGK